jgi:hypothetical protein
MNKNKYPYRIDGDLDEAISVKLYEVCSRWCAFAQLIQRNELSQTGLAQLSALEFFGDSVSKVSEWPGTQLLGGATALAHRFSLTQGCVEELAKVVPSPLYRGGPGSLEDLCFLRCDKSPMMASITHEQDCFFLLFEEEVVVLKMLLGATLVAE